MIQVDHLGACLKSVTSHQDTVLQIEEANEEINDVIETLKKELAKEKNPNMTPELAAELEQDINNYVRSMGLSSKDFITATPSTLLAEDESILSQ